MKRNDKQVLNDNDKKCREAPECVVHWDVHKRESNKTKNHHGNEETCKWDALKKQNNVVRKSRK